MPFTITTWNIQNFTRNSDRFTEKLDYLATTIQSLNSDVVALQEVLDLDALAELAGELNFQAHAANPDGRGNRVAFLTRAPFNGETEEITEWQLAPGAEIRCIDSDEQIVVVPQLPRPALKLTVIYEGNEIDIINIHMKSKLLTFGGNFSTRNETLRVQTAYFALERRAGEAATLRESATNMLSEGRGLVVVGDFNDGPQSATTEMLYGPPGSQPRSLEDAQRPNSAFQRGDAGDAQRLFNVCNLVAEDQRWSRRHQGQVELLDHILASEILMPRDNAELRQVPTMSILNEDVPNLLGSNPNVSGVVPDHAPVTATFI